MWFWGRRGVSCFTPFQPHVHLDIQIISLSELRDPPRGPSITPPPTPPHPFPPSPLYCVCNKLTKQSERKRDKLLTVSVTRRYVHVHTQPCFHRQPFDSVRLVRDVRTSSGPFWSSTDRCRFCFPCPGVCMSIIPECCGRQWVGSCCADVPLLL